MSQTKDISADYNNCTIKNIRRGKGARSTFVYADFYSESGVLLMNATLDRITETLEDRMPGKPKVEDDYDNEL